MPAVTGHLEEFLTTVTTGGSGDDIALGMFYLPPSDAAQRPGTESTGSDEDSPNATVDPPSEPLGVDVPASDAALAGDEP